MKLVPLITLLMLMPSVTTLENHSEHWNRLSSYSTSFHCGQTARNKNILLAASILDGQQIAPYSEFSFNKTVGERSREGGFVPAKMLEAGQLMDSEGGGVCLVSSVLYSAAVLGGMTVVERHPHSRLVPYIQPGQDSAVDYPSKDLRFRNTFDDPIQLRTEVTGCRLTVSIFSKGVQRPVDFQVHTYRTKLLDGAIQVYTYRRRLDTKLQSQEELSVDVYPGQGE